MRKRKTYSPELKTEIVLKVLREEQSMAQIASEYGLHTNQLSNWKKQFLKDAPLLFKNENKPLAELKSKFEKKEDELYKEIGKLTAQVSWLKKKCGNIEQG